MSENYLSLVHCPNIRRMRFNKKFSIKKENEQEKEESKNDEFLVWWVGWKKLVVIGKFKKEDRNTLKVFFQNGW